MNTDCGWCGHKLYAHEGHGPCKVVCGDCGAEQGD